VVKPARLNTVFATVALLAKFADSAAEILIWPFAASIVKPEPWNDFNNVATFAATLALVKYKLPAVSITLAVYNLFHIFDVTVSATILLAAVDPV